MRIAKYFKSATLSILGAGPKALAVGLRAHVLKELGLKTPEITIIEKNEVAAHWTGKHGFTNGKLTLGTSPEKDLGFPYEHNGTSLSAKVNSRLLDFSWRSYLIKERRYSEWVDRGSPQPSHQQWGAYLKFVAKEISSTVNFINAEVISAKMQGNSWALKLQQNNAEVTHLSDALMLTGPAIPRTPACYPSDRILNMQNLWIKLGEIPKNQKVKIAVVGNGETAASVLIALNKGTFPEAEIEVIAPRGAIFTRGESFLENRFYSTSHLTHWKKMTLEDRLNFIRRTDIGVFSPNALAELRFEDFRIIAGRVNCAKKTDSGVSISVEYNEAVEERNYDYVIFASGLNHKKLLEKIIDPTSFELLLQANAGVDLEENICEDLSVKNIAPKLYLPMLAGLQQGPGFANLSCLGLLASRILDPLCAELNTARRIEENYETRYRLHSA